MAVTRTIDIRTDIPGPRSREILDRKEQVVAEPLSIYLRVVIAEGHGVTLTDVDGNTFIDFTGGVGCLNVGHSHPRVVAAAQEQLTKFSHTDFTIVPYEVYVELAERLIALTPISGEKRAAFFNAGTEAVENSIKFARTYTKRQAVICFEGAFHGRTLLSMTMTSKTHPYKAGLGPFAPEVYRVPFPHSYRGPDVEAALAALERALLTQVAPENVAAIVIEPVLGEGGFVVAPPEFLQGVRKLCDEHGIVFVVDEVQTGFGRTGKMWAIEHAGRRGGPDHDGEVDRRGPSAFGRHRPRGDHGRVRPTRRSAAPMSAIRSRRRPRLAVLDVFEDEGLVARAAALGDQIRSRMESLAAAISRGRRRPRARDDARDRARQGSREQGTGRRRRHGDRRSGRRARPAAAQVGHLLELHSRARAARDRGRRARRSARRLGRRALNRAFLSRI